MDETTIFSPNQTSPLVDSTPSVQSPSSPVPTIPTASIDPVPFYPKEEDSFFSSGKLVKVFLGILFVAIVVFVAAKIIFPLFSPKKSEAVTLTYWGLWEEGAVFQSLIADFERQNPSIKVSYVKQDNKQYRERVSTRVQNGTGPDIFRFHNTWLVELKNILLPMPSDTIRKEDFQKWYYPVASIDLVKNGAIYGVPLEIDTLALFTNTEALQAVGVSVPTSWEEFGKTARLLTVVGEDGKIKTAGAALGTFDNITHAPDIVSLLFLQNGADLRNLSQTTKNASDALEYYASFTKGDASVWDGTLEPSLLAFASGNLAMYFGYSWDIFSIKAINPNLAFDVSAVPHLPGRNITIASYWAEGVSSKSKHQKEALLFIKFLSQKETALKFYTQVAKTRVFGEPYARVDLAQLLSDNKLIYPFVAQGNDARSSFFVSDTYDNGLNEQVNGYLGNAVRSVLGNTSPESAVETLSKGVAQVLKQYGE